jgi:hypothetical protein
MEGTATYASERMNSSESLLRVLLDDQDLARMSDAELRAVMQSVLDHFDDSDDAAVARFFDTGYRGAWPARAGYHVGLLAAREIGTHLSLKEMASLSEAQFRPALVQAIDLLLRGKGAR